MAKRKNPNPYASKPNKAQILSSELPDPPFVAKRQKTTHGDSQDEDAAQQRLRSYDDLPEGVMSVIASKLELRDLVRASAACRAWSNLATYLTDIRISSSSIFGPGNRLCSAYRQSFIKAVTQFLAYYDKLLPAWAHTPLRSFGICYCLHRESLLHINSWIKFAISKGVTSIDMKLACPHQHITFRLPPRDAIQSPSQAHAASARVPSKRSTLDHYRFPWHELRTASRLKKLVLDSSRFGAPTLFRPLHCPFLKVLELSFVSLDTTDLSRIFNACSNLESVLLFKCALFGSIVITCCPQLRSLSLQHCKANYYESKRTIEKLEGVSLAEFRYAGVGPIVFKSICVPKLADISYCVKTREGIDYAFEKLHLDFPNMQTLSVTLDSHSVSHLHDRMASLHKLQKLQLYCLPNGKFSLLTMMKILEASPHLTTLSMVPPYTFEQESCADDVLLHETFFHERLKTVKLSGFCGCKNHVELAKMLVQVSDLHHLIINTSVERDWWGDQAPESVFNSLLGMMKGGKVTFCGMTSTTSTT